MEVMRGVTGITTEEFIERFDKEELTENDLKLILNLAFYLEDTDKLEWDILEHSNNYKIFKIGNRCFLQVHYPNMQIFELRSERYL